MLTLLSIPCLQSVYGMLMPGCHAHAYTLSIRLCHALWPVLESLLVRCNTSMSQLIVQLSTPAPWIQQLSPGHTAQRCLWAITMCVCVYSDPKRYLDTQVTLNV